MENRNSRTARSLYNRPTSTSSIAWSASNLLAIATGSSCTILGAANLSGPRSYLSLPLFDGAHLLDLGGAPAHLDECHDPEILRPITIARSLIGTYPVTIHSLCWGPLLPGASIHPPRQANQEEDEDARRPLLTNMDDSLEPSCPLAVLSTDGQVRIYLPPPMLDAKWRESFNLTTLLSTLLHKTKWTLEGPHDEAMEEGDHPALRLRGGGEGEEEEEVNPPPAKKRGRPRKNPLPPTSTSPAAPPPAAPPRRPQRADKEEEEKEEGAEEEEEEEEVVEKKKRGRPRKNPLPEGAAPPQPKKPRGPPRKEAPAPPPPPPPPRVRQGSWHHDDEEQDGGDGDDAPRPPPPADPLPPLPLPLLPPALLHATPRPPQPPPSQPSTLPTMVRDLIHRSTPMTHKHGVRIKSVKKTTTKDFHLERTNFQQAERLNRLVTQRATTAHKSLVDTASRRAGQGGVAEAEWLRRMALSTVSSLAWSESVVGGEEASCASSSYVALGTKSGVIFVFRMDMQGQADEDQGGGVEFKSKGQLSLALPPDGVKTPKPLERGRASDDEEEEEEQRGGGEQERGQGGMGEREVKASQLATRMLASRLHCVGFVSAQAHPITHLSLVTVPGAVESSLLLFSGASDGSVRCYKASASCLHATKPMCESNEDDEGDEDEVRLSPAPFTLASVCIPSDQTAITCIHASALLDPDTQPSNETTSSSSLCRGVRVAVGKLFGQVHVWTSERASSHGTTAPYPGPILAASSGVVTQHVASLRLETTEGIGGLCVHPMHHVVLIQTADGQHVTMQVAPHSSETRSTRHFPPLHVDPIPRTATTNTVTASAAPQCVLPRRPLLLLPPCRLGFGLAASPHGLFVANVHCDKDQVDSAPTGTTSEAALSESQVRLHRLFGVPCEMDESWLDKVTHDGGGNKDKEVLPPGFTAQSMPATLTRLCPPALNVRVALVTMTLGRLAISNKTPPPSRPQFALDSFLPMDARMVWELGTALKIPGRVDIDISSTHRVLLSLEAPLRSVLDKSGRISPLPPLDAWSNVSLARLQASIALRHLLGIMDDAPPPSPPPGGGGGEREGGAVWTKVGSIPIGRVAEFILLQLHVHHMMANAFHGKTTETRRDRLSALLAADLTQLVAFGPRSSSTSAPREVYRSLLPPSLLTTLKAMLDRAARTKVKAGDESCVVFRLDPHRPDAASPPLRERHASSSGLHARVSLASLTLAKNFDATPYPDPFLSAGASAEATGREEEEEEEQEQGRGGRVLLARCARTLRIYNPAHSLLCHCCSRLYRNDDPHREQSCLYCGLVLGSMRGVANVHVSLPQPCLS